MAMSAALGVGPTSYAMTIFSVVEGVFYMAQWEEYHTGTLNWSNGWVGVTESQLFQMGLFLASALFGELDGGEGGRRGGGTAGGGYSRYCYAFAGAPLSTYLRDEATEHCSPHPNRSIFWLKKEAGLGVFNATECMWFSIC